MVEKMATKETVLTDAEIIAIGHQASATEVGENGYILPIAFARAIEQAVLQSTEIQELRDALERCRFALEPYDDVKPRDWKTDRENLRHTHQAVCAALAAMEKKK